MRRSEFAHNRRALERQGPPRVLAAYCFLLLIFTVSVLAEVGFQYVELDDTYFAYQRDVGDIDGDGDNDVVGIQEGDTHLEVFRAPSWTRSTLITFTGTDRYPRADDFKLADLNGDGRLDVVTRLGSGPFYDGPANAVWCENLGNGSFTQRLIGNSLSYVKDIVVVDLDRDGRLDVVMRMDSQTQLWLQEANGTWTEVLLDHPSHEGMEASDLDMDGDPDLVLNGFWFATPNTPATARVAANYTQRTIDGVWFNQGTVEGFANSCKVVVGDFDGDGTNDVAFSQSEAAGYDVAWYRSSGLNGAGPWVKHAVTAVDYCHNLQAADFDLDGKVDLLVGGMIQSSQRGLKLMLNQGGGNNWSPLVIQSNGSYSAEMGDIDKDGDLDIVGIRNWDSGPTWIYRNNAVRPPSLDLWFYKQVSAAHERTFSLCFPDVNGDGNKDIASGSFVYLNPGPPLTGDWTQIPLPGDAHAFATLDVDGDNLADLIAQKDNPGAGHMEIYWIEAAHTGGTSWSTPILIGDVPRGNEPEGFQGYAVAQINPGGRSEIIINSPQGLYYLNVPANNPETGNWPRTFIAPNNSEEGIGVADLDKDGDLDISFSSGGVNQIKWARNPGNGSGDWDVFTIGTFPEAAWPDRCAAADLNGDGRVDLVVTEENFTGAADALACWWEQPATGPTNANWVRHTITTQYTMNNLDVGDVDKDGDVDLVLAEHRGTKRIAVWANDRAGNFTEHPVDEGKESHLGGRLVDLDADGDLDLVSIAYDSFNQLHLWRNDGNRKTPLVIGSVAAAGSTAVQIVFSKPLEQGSAQFPGNYNINKGVVVTWALLGPDARTVTLITSPLHGGTYTLAMDNIGGRDDPLDRLAAVQTNFSFAPALTPITFDSAASARDLDANDNANLTLVQGTLTNGYLVVGVSMWDADPTVSITAATYDGVPMSFLGTAQSASSYAEVYLFGLAVGDKAPGNYPVSLQASANVEQIVFGASAFSGVHQTVATRAFASVNGVFRPPTGLSSVPLVRVASAAGEMVVDILGYDDGSSVLGPGQTQNWRVADLTTLSDGVSSRNSALAATTTMSHTLNFQGVEWAIGAVALKRAAFPVVDSAPPTLTITSPASNARLTNSFVTFRGTSADAGGVAAVEYRLENANGVSNYQLAEGTTAWSASVVNLAAGLNTVRVRARDRNGNPSSTVTRSITLVVLSPFTLTVNGNGTVGPNRNGQLLEIGKSFTMTARPVLRHLFTGWSGGIASSNATLSFLMQSNLIVRASFATNPFVGLKGSYYGLFGETNEVRNHDHSGSFSLMVSEPGSYSASFHLGGRRYSATGRFDWLGRSRLSLRPSPTNVVTVELQLDVTNLTSGVNGFVGDGAWLAELSGFRAPVYPGTNSSPFIGRYTMAVPGRDDGASVNASGHGFGSLTVSRQGLLRYSGKLADGSLNNFSVPVSEEGFSPFYVSLYSGKGSVLGWIELDESVDGDIQGTLSWSKPALVTSKLFPLGFTNSTGVIGSRYAAPATGQRVLNFTNGTVEFSFGNLAQPFTNDVTMSANNRVTNLSSNRLVLTIVPSTGSFTGSATDPNSGKTVVFHGAVLQKQGAGFGYFLGTNQSGRVVLAPAP